MTAYPMFDPSSLIAGTKHPTQRSITLASGSNVAGTPLKRGALLGRTTATDTYTLCKTTATDGSQTPVAVLAGDTDAGAASVSTSAYFEGEFAGEIMTLDPSWTIPTLQTALRQANSGLFVRSLGVLG